VAVKVHVESEQTLRNESCFHGLVQALLVDSSRSIVLRDFAQLGELLGDPENVSSEVFFEIRKCNIVPGDSSGDGDERQKLAKIRCSVLVTSVVVADKLGDVAVDLRLELWVSGNKLQKHSVEHAIAFESFQGGVKFTSHHGYNHSVHESGQNLQGHVRVKLSSRVTES
jgi:hypothetical protein